MDVPLENVQWTVEHIPVGRVVSERPEVRQEGDTLVYPVLEERLVVTREFHLREEVRVTRVLTTSEQTVEQNLRYEELVETREKL